MKRNSLNRNLVLGAVLLGISSLSLTGCGQKTSEEHVLAARQFVEAKDNPSAIIEYKSAIQKDPKDPDARFELGQLYLQQKDFAAAEKELNRALDLGYEVSEVLPLITRAYQETNSEVALSEINHNVDGLTPVKRAEVTYYKLEALLRLEKNKEARVLLEDIAKDNLLQANSAQNTMNEFDTFPFETIKIIINMVFGVRNLQKWI